MTVFSLVFRTDWYAANGLNKDWSYDFALIEEAVVVEVKDADGDITTFENNFTFFPTDDSSGFVRYPAVGDALATGNSVRISRWIDYTQPTAIGAQGRFNPELHERGLDRATMQIQQLYDWAIRAIAVAVGGTGGTWVPGDEGDLIAYGPDGGAVSAGISVTDLITLIAEMEAIIADIEGLDYATVAEVRSAAAGNKIVTAETIETASAFVTLVDAATIALDWDSGINFSVTLGDNRTLDNPTNGQPGTWRMLLVHQDGVGGRTLGFGNQYKFSFGVEPVVSATADAVDILSIFCVSATEFYLFYNQNITA